MNAGYIYFFGGLDKGPMNNGCYSWNWHECFDKSIYNPGGASNASSSTTLAHTVPTTAQPLFDGTQDIDTTWSEPLNVLAGTAWHVSMDAPRCSHRLSTLDLIVELEYEQFTLENENMYLGFGVAEQRMQGALIVCSPRANPTDATSVTSRSTCNTYVGSGMGVKNPENDAVQPMALKSEKNATLYMVRFSANLFGCWANPHWPARVLFSRGLTSGNGDPMSHLNNAMHRQAVTGIEFLSVVDGSNTTTTGSLQQPPSPLPLRPLPEDSYASPVPGTGGLLEILQVRVRVAYELLHYGNDFEEVIKIQLKNVLAFGGDDDLEKTRVST